MSRIFDDFIKAEEIARKVYYGKLRKYLGYIYLITSLYLPIGYGLFQVLRLLNTSYSLLNVESFILIFIPILFFHSKLVKLYKMINKLNDIQFGKNKYGKV